IVSNARLDLPLPDSPVITIRRSRGSATVMSLRLCSRAPRTTIWSWAIRVQCSRRPSNRTAVRTALWPGRGRAGAGRGRAVAALVGLVGGCTWAELRIPVAATLTFNAAAAFAAAVTVQSGDRGVLPVFILVAASLFAVLSAYWLIRNVGPAVPAGAAVEGV